VQSLGKVSGTFKGRELVCCLINLEILMVSFVLLQWIVYKGGNWKQHFNTISSVFSSEVISSSPRLFHGSGMMLY